LLTRSPRSTWIASITPITGEPTGDLLGLDQAPQRLGGERLAATDGGDGKRHRQAAEHTV